MCFQEARICTLCGCQAYKWEVCGWRENAFQLKGDGPGDRRNRWQYTKDPCRNCEVHAAEDEGTGKGVYNTAQSKILSTNLWDTCVYLILLSRRYNLRWRCSVCNNINTSGPQCRFFRVVDPDTVEDNQLPPGITIPRAPGPRGRTQRGGGSRSEKQQTVLLERCGHMISGDCAILNADFPYEEKLIWDSPFPFAEKPVSLKPSRYGFRDKYIFELPPFPAPERGLFVPPVIPQATPGASSNIKSEPDLDPRDNISSNISLPAVAPYANGHGRNIAPLPIVKTERDFNPAFNTMGTGTRSVYTNTPPNNLERPIEDVYREMGFADVLERYKAFNVRSDNRMALDTPSVRHRDSTAAVLPIIKKEGDHAGATGFSTTTTSAGGYSLTTAISIGDRVMGTGARGGYPTSSEVDRHANKVTKHSSKIPSARARDTKSMTRLRGHSKRRAGSDDGGEYIRNPAVVKEEEARPRARDPNAKFIDSLRGDESDSDQLRRNPVDGFPSDEAIAKYERMEEEMEKRKKEERLQTGNSATKDKPRESRSTRHGATTDSDYPTSESPSKRRRTHGNDGSSSRAGSVGPWRGSRSGEQRHRTDGARQE